MWFYFLTLNFPVSTCSRAPFGFVSLSLSLVFFCFVKLGPVAPLHQTSLLPVIARFWPSLETWGPKTSGKHFVWWQPMWNATAELWDLAEKSSYQLLLPLGDRRGLRHNLSMAWSHKYILPALLVGTVKPMIRTRTPLNTPHPTSRWIGVKPPFLVNGRSKFGIGDARGSYDFAHWSSTVSLPAPGVVWTGRDCTSLTHSWRRAPSLLSPSHHFLRF